MHTERLCWVVAGGPNTYKGLTVMKHNETQGLLQTSSQTTLSETKIKNRVLFMASLSKKKHPRMSASKQSVSNLPLCETFESIQEEPCDLATQEIMHMVFH